jgi:hypothetical protein
MESGACLLSYFFVFWDNGLASKDLVGFGSGGDVILTNGTLLDMDAQQIIINKAMYVLFPSENRELSRGAWKAEESWGRSCIELRCVREVLRAADCLLTCSSALLVLVCVSCTGRRGTRRWC